MEKTVWIINHYALTPAQGGLCRHYYFAKELAGRGYRVRIFTSSVIHNTDINMIGKGDKGFFKDVEYDGVTYTYLKSSPYKGNGVSRIRNMLGFAFSIKKIWKKYGYEKPDVIYTSSPDIFTAWKAEKVAKKHDVPCVAEVRDLWPLSIVEYKNYSEKNPAIRLLYGLEKKIYKRADAIIFTMEGGVDYIRKKGWDKTVKAEKIFNVNNGISIANQREEREKFVLYDEDLDSDCFKVIYAGSVRTVNQVDILVKAFILLKERKDIKCLIYGDGDKRKELEEYCLKNGIKNVIFKGRVDKSYIPYVCSKAGVNFISVRQTRVSEFGVSWNKLYDYMFAGKPIISSVSVNYDNIIKYDCGISLDDQSPESVAAAILKIRNLPSEEYERLGNNASRAAEDFDFGILTDKLEKVFEYAEKNHRRK